MFESAAIIFDYLPIRFQSESEDEYQWYLWDSFMALINNPTSPASRFSLVPFHLLFMLAAQYKALRVRKSMPEQHKHVFTFRGICKNHMALLDPTSPYDFSNLNERSLFDIFRLVDATDRLIGRAKALVDRRNDLAHVNGIIETNIDETIEEYLAVLLELQKLFQPINDTIAQEWLNEMEPEEDRTAFAELRLAAAYLCLADLNGGLLAEHFPRDGIS